MRWPLKPAPDSDGNVIDQDAVNELVDYAIAHGVNYFDTSPVYCQGMTKILQGEHLSYERVRKWLILLIFYTWWAQRALNTGGYEAGQKDGQRFLSFMDQALVEAGYPEMYVGNPYDWIFFFCAQDQEPLRLFREIWNILLGEKLEEHP